MRKYLAPVVARYSSILVQFALVTIVTRVLSQDEAGHYFVIMGVVFATYSLAGFGLPDGTVRFAPALAVSGAETTAEQEADTLMAIGWRYSLLLIPFGAVISGLMVFGYTGNAVTALLTALWWASYGVIFVAAQTLVARGRSSLGSGVFYSAANAGQIIVSVPVILLTRLDRLDSVVAATVAGTAAAAVVCLLIARPGEGRLAPHRPALRQAWHQGALIAAGRVVQSCLLWSPVWVAGLLLGPADAATVGVASRVVSGVAAVIAAVRFSIRPELARDAAHDDWAAIQQHSSRIALYATSLALTAMVAFWLVGDLLIGTVFGADYRAAGTVTALMLIGTLGESFAGPVDEVLRMSGHAGEVVIAQTAALCAGLIGQGVAAAVSGVSALAGIYGLTFVLLYIAFNCRLRTLHEIVVLPRLTST